MKKLLLFIIVLSFNVFASNTSYECLGADSGNLYNLVVIDVGDSEGSVEVNDGGAPQLFDAYYRDGSFIYGSEYQNRIELRPVGFMRWSRASVEHDRMIEEATCIVI